MKYIVLYTHEPHIDMNINNCAIGYRSAIYPFYNTVCAFDYNPKYSQNLRLSRTVKKKLSRNIFRTKIISMSEI